MNEKDRHHEDEIFEKNLREILSSGSNSPKKESAGHNLPKQVSQTNPNQPAESSSESKVLFWANLVRIIAFIVLMGLLALFINQITSRG